VGRVDLSAPAGVRARRDRWLCVRCAARPFPLVISGVTWACGRRPPRATCARRCRPLPADPQDRIGSARNGRVARALVRTVARARWLTSVLRGDARVVRGDRQARARHAGGRQASRGGRFALALRGGAHKHHRKVAAVPRLRPFSIAFLGRLLSAVRVCQRRIPGIGCDVYLLEPFLVGHWHHAPFHKNSCNPYDTAPIIW
jgi:hypothetical protein